MPHLPLPAGLSTVGGGDLPVRDVHDVLVEFPRPQRNAETAVVRDAMASAFAEGFLEYQNVAERAAALSDPLRATGDYLRSYAEEHQVVPAAGEGEASLQSRIFRSPEIVTPDAIEDAINAIISPLTCAISEQELDGWFIHAGGVTAWDSFVGAAPNYPDRLYDEVPSASPGACVPSNGLPRSFHVRVPALEAANSEFAFIGDAMFIGNDCNIYEDQETANDLYAAIVGRVNSIKGHGISWSLFVDPSL